jgi:hypothetical protein
MVRRWLLSCHRFYVRRALQRPGIPATVTSQHGGEPSAPPDGEVWAEGRQRLARAPARAARRFDVQLDEVDAPKDALTIECVAMLGVPSDRHCRARRTRRPHGIRRLASESPRDESGLRPASTRAFGRRPRTAQPGPGHPLENTLLTPGQLCPAASRCGLFHIARLVLFRYLSPRARLTFAAASVAAHGVMDRRDCSIGMGVRRAEGPCDTDWRD